MLNLYLVIIFYWNNSTRSESWNLIGSIKKIHTYSSKRCLKVLLNMLEPLHAWCWIFADIHYFFVKSLMKDEMLIYILVNPQSNVETRKVQYSFYCINKSSSVAIKMIYYCSQSFAKKLQCSINIRVPKLSMTANEMGELTRVTADCSTVWLKLFPLTQLGRVWEPHWCFVKNQLQLLH